AAAEALRLEQEAEARRAAEASRIEAARLAAEANETRHVKVAKVFSDSAARVRARRVRAR
ncbi:hypothetical protein, partial [Jatrophihabitans sp.]|uniref:hypothetical protein n=1 Tax=Jatrophihabitans sp. TaxID=1932789 RepID=UPI0030C6BB6D|nr:hypothetical protein [Jatrophihabitans sp.]